MRLPRVSRSTLLVTVLIVLAAARIATTFRVFSQVMDEPAHIGAGMEWLDRGTYTLELQQPPLARIFAATGPYLAGIRYHAAGHMVDEGNRILGEGDRYAHNLALARFGVLPFFFTAAIVVFAWGRRAGGKAVGVVSLLLFSTVPIVLGYAGLAITDMAATATIVWALFRWREWLENPRPRNAVALGATCALALLAKFSAVLFLPAGFVAIAIAHLPAPRTASAPRRGVSLAIALGCAILVIWAGYRFSFGTIRNAGRLPVDTINETFGTEGIVHDLAWRFVERVPIPAPEIPLGILHVREHDRAGHEAFLLGERRTTGWWYYFPFAVVVKTPLAFLLLFAAGAFFAMKHRHRLQLEVILPAIVILGVSMTSGINIGVRHVLPIYPLMAIVAGAGCVALWRSGIAGRIVASILIAWQLASSIAAHPDNFPYVNELAGRHPERVLSDSNFDWGQDLIRLRRALRRHNADSVWLDCFGSANLGDLHFPPSQSLDPQQPVDGWIAVSQMKLYGTGDAERLGWLLQHEPVERVGKTILLFHVPERNADRHTVLLPLSLQTPLRTSSGEWVTKLVARNRSARAAFIETPDAPAERVYSPPASTLSDALARSKLDGSRGRLLSVDASLDLHLYLYELTRGSGVELPIARAADLRSGAAAFEPFALSPRSRAVIRVYTLVPGTIAVRWPGGSRALSTTTETATALPSAQLDVSNIAIPGEPIVVELMPEDASLRYWGFATVTDQTTIATRVFRLRDK